MSTSSRDTAAATRVLILGGSSEATALVQALAGRTDIAATLSLAGRTRTPIAQPISTRVGGFGGVDGLVTYLCVESIDLLVDATHPFATHMSRNAREAARRADCRLVTVSRPAWTPRPGDLWQEVDDMTEAVAALGPKPRRVFLTVGRLQIEAFAQAPHHHYLVRTIDPIADHGLADAAFIEARGPFDRAAEARLMRDHRIDVLVTKNSGGTAAAAKLDAARGLLIPVILLRRPDAGAPSGTVADAIAAIESRC